jgi:hypothetical protein
MDRFAALAEPEGEPDSQDEANEESDSTLPETLAADAQPALGQEIKNRQNNDITLSAATPKRKSQKHKNKSQRKKAAAAREAAAAAQEKEKTMIEMLKRVRIEEETRSSIYYEIEKLQQATMQLFEDPKAGVGDEDDPNVQEFMAPFEQASKILPENVMTFIIETGDGETIVVSLEQLLKMKAAGIDVNLFSVRKTDASGASSSWQPMRKSNSMEDSTGGRQSELWG